LPDVHHRHGSRSHGTWVVGSASGIIANGEGVAGFAGNCRTLPWATGTFSSVDAALGLDAAVPGDPRNALAICDDRACNSRTAGAVGPAAVLIEDIVKQVVANRRTVARHGRKVDSV